MTYGETNDARVYMNLAGAVGGYLLKKAASWPAAPHDMAKMGSDPKLAETSKKVIEVHKEIIAMFQKMVAAMEAQQKKMMMK